MSLLGFTTFGAGPPLLWLHGFTQTNLSGQRFLSKLAGSHEILAIDLPGHGTSSHIEADFDQTVSLVMATAHSIGWDSFAVAGYSMGGRIALHLAAEHRATLSHLITIGATMGIVDDQERQERTHRDAALALHISDIGSSAFLDEWLVQPMFGGLDPTFERDYRSSDADGLARSVVSLSPGRQQQLDKALAHFGQPTLALAGEFDTKYVKEAQRIATTVQHGTARTIAGAHHAAHIQNPAAASHIVLEFLTSP
jgi:2-succinyl-6-hydroxy-2,4-cyclohexadiene-1-carboxylate synthase